jgi:hypothetical protein
LLNAAILYDSWFWKRLGNDQRQNNPMEHWQKALDNSLTRPEELANLFNIDAEPLKPVVKQYPMRISRYYLSLIQKPGDPIWLQCVPDPRELEDDNLSVDPLNEESLTPVPGLIHRYPDRVVLLVSPACPTLCRFCMRKSRIGHQRILNGNNPGDAALKYIERTHAIRDVILSGAFKALQNFPPRNDQDQHPCTGHPAGQDNAPPLQDAETLSSALRKYPLQSSVRNYTTVHRSLCQVG